MSIDKDSLGDRMKSYEALSTSRYLMPNTPIYARIDGRAFHTFCHGLEKPFSKEFISCMQEVAKNLVAEFSAMLGYVESDEISLSWGDSSKAPFEGRIQKLESTLASAAGAYMNKEIFGTDKYPSLRARALKHVPMFDCRCFNIAATGESGLEELVNAYLWRENDAIKNSISGMALNFFSHNQLQNKNSDEKIHMMRMKGWCFYEDTDEAFMRGTFFKRQLFDKILSKEELERIPAKNRPLLDENGVVKVIRSEIRKLEIPYRLTDISNKVGVLFNGEQAVKNKENVTFDLTKKG